MTAVVTLSDEFQILVPDEIRNAQGWRVGQRLAFLPKGDCVLLVPVPSRADLFGIAAGANTDGDLDRRDRY